MKYLKISNRGSLNRKYLELIGLSTKRALKADESVIGHKGSGTKLSAVAALRLGLDVAIASTDSYGTYHLTFDVETIDIDGTEARQIFFNYANVASGKKVDRLRYPSGMVLEAFQDWDKPIGKDDKLAFKVLREFVCNAVDADKQARIEIVEKPTFAADGETSVYLRLTDEVREILATSDRYFKFLSKTKPVLNVPAVGCIYPKSEPEEKGGLLSRRQDPKTRLFVQGVLVDCDDTYYRTSLFDYSLHEKTLVSEERIIKSFTEYVRTMGKIFGQLADQEIAKQVLAAATTGHAKLEEQALGQVDEVTPAAKAVWTAIAHGLYGKTLAVASGNTTVDKDCNQICGYTVIGAHSTYLRHFFVKLGFPKAEDLVPTLQKNMAFTLVAYADLDAESRARFQGAFGRFADYFPERSHLPIVFYNPLGENFRRIAAFSGMGKTKYEEIWIGTKTATSLGDEESLFQSLLHEGRHCETKADDYERPFVGRADKEVLELVYGRTLPEGVTRATVPNVVDPKTRNAKGEPVAASADPATVIDRVGDEELQRMLDELITNEGDPKKP